jgi:hypothetical protein
MKTLPLNVNIVVLASNYNPSILSKEWLYQKGIFTDKIINFVFTPVFSLVESETHSMMVDEGRLQYSIKKVAPESLNSLTDAVAQFVKTLPETPYKSVGINYVYVVQNEKCDLGKLLNPNKATLSQLIAPDLRLGFMAAFQFEGFLVNLSITPSSGGGGAQTRISFNFHSGVANQNEVLSKLALCPATLKKAESVIQGVCGNA